MTSFVTAFNVHNKSTLKVGSKPTLHIGTTRVPCEVEELWRLERGGSRTNITVSDSRFGNVRLKLLKPAHLADCPSDVYHIMDNNAIVATCTGQIQTTEEGAPVPIAQLVPPGKKGGKGGAQVQSATARPRKKGGKKGKQKRQ
jgi:hypothetical protein